MGRRAALLLGVVEHHPSRLADGDGPTTFVLDPAGGVFRVVPGEFGQGVVHRLIVAPDDHITPTALNEMGHPDIVPGGSQGVRRSVSMASDPLSDGRFGRWL